MVPKYWEIFKNLSPISRLLKSLVSFGSNVALEVMTISTTISLWAYPFLAHLLTADGMSMSQIAEPSKKNDPNASTGEKNGVVDRDVYITFNKLSL